MGGILSEPAIFSGIKVLSICHRLPTFVLRSGAAEMTCATNIFRLLFTTKGGGTGMGLSISTILESHGGRIWLAANEPYGARFWVIFGLREDVTKSNGFVDRHEVRMCNRYHEHK
jgi:hypothetical protein